MRLWLVRYHTDICMHMYVSVLGTSAVYVRKHITCALRSFDLFRCSNIFLSHVETYAYVQSRSSK